jgi:hypothetical protein
VEGTGRQEEGYIAESKWKARRRVDSGGRWQTRGGGVVEGDGSQEEGEVEVVKWQKIPKGGNRGNMEGKRKRRLWNEDGR